MKIGGALTGPANPPVSSQTQVDARKIESLCILVDHNIGAIAYSNDIYLEMRCDDVRFMYLCTCSPLPWLYRQVIGCISAQLGVCPLNCDRYCGGVSILPSQTTTTDHRHGRDRPSFMDW